MSVLGLGFCYVPNSEVVESQVKTRLAIIRCATQGGLTQFYRSLYVTFKCLDLTDKHIYLCSAISVPGIFLIEGDGPVKVGQRLLVALHPAIGLPSACYRPGIFLMQGDGSVKVGQRLLVAFHLAVGLASVGYRPSELLIQRNGPVKVSQRLLVALHQPIRLSSVGYRPSELLIESDGPVEVSQLLLFPSMVDVA